jgi:hypothetical protein
VRRDRLDDSDLDRDTVRYFLSLFSDQIDFASIPADVNLRRPLQAVLDLSEDYGFDPLQS